MKGLATPEADLPASLRLEDLDQTQTLAPFLGLVAKQLARQNKVDPGLLATTTDLHDVLRWSLAGGAEKRPSVLEGWRGEILANTMLALVQGRMTVRITDPESRTPFSIEALG